MNNEKIISLNEQKISFLDKEINSLKEKNLNLSKQNKSKEDLANKEINNLKEQIKTLKMNSNENNNNNEDVNINLNNLMKYFKENFKLQNEENKNMLEKMIKQKEKFSENDNTELLNNYNELSKKYSELNINLNLKESKIKSLEEEISKLNLYKEIIMNCKGFKCKICDKIFNFDNIKKHSHNSLDNKINNTNNAIDLNANFDKMKIKILKGIIKQDELNKPFLEYILEINYNNQTWRINKKFIQFANLYNNLKTVFKGVVEMPLSSNIFVNISEKRNRTFYSNKIIQLENFINDLVSIEAISNSKQFKKFLEFDKNIDDEEDEMILMNKRNNNLDGNGFIENENYKDSQDLSCDATKVSNMKM